MNEGSLNAKQEMKRKRTRTFFLEAAKTMIINEGVESVSVRKVADAAGYSYPTLYSYFEDLNELLWEVRLYMIHDLWEYISKGTVIEAVGPEELKYAFRKYAEYYLANPNIFKFFYFHRPLKPSSAREESMTEPDYASIWHTSLKGLVESGRLREEDVDTVVKTMIYSVQGMLTLRFSGDMQDDATLYKDLDAIIDHILS